MGLNYIDQKQLFTALQQFLLQIKNKGKSFYGFYGAPLDDFVGSFFKVVSCRDILREANLKEYLSISLSVLNSDTC